MTSPILEDLNKDKHLFKSGNESNLNDYGYISDYTNGNDFTITQNVGSTLLTITTNDTNNDKWTKDNNTLGNYYYDSNNSINGETNAPDSAIVGIVSNASDSEITFNFNTSSTTYQYLLGVNKNSGIIYVSAYIDNDYIDEFVLSANSGGKLYIYTPLFSHSTIKFVTEESLIISGIIQKSLSDIFTAGNLPCFFKGAKILTPNGEINIEDLRNNDYILNKDNEIKKIKMVGHITTMFKGDKTIPYIIEKNTFGLNKPHSDLYISPQHAILLNNKMIMTMDIKDYSTIYRKDIMYPYTYYSILLDKYDTLIVNGIVAESLHPSNKNIEYFNHNK
jgi:hypothetical protein